ncbi:MAG: uroporphyrinogen decarboxylase family protein [Spirochaetia bacterium]
MTSRERFLKVLSGEMPDRVPVTTFILDQGHFISQLYPDVDPEDFETLQLKIAEVQRQFGMDVCVRLLFGLNDPLFIHMGGVNTSVQTDTWEVDTEVIHKDNVTIYRSTIRTPDGTITQDFSKNEVRPGTFLYACTDKPVKRPEDLDILIKYEPKMPEEWPRQVKKRLDTVKEAVGDDGIVSSWTPHGPFNNSSLLFSHDELYMLFLTEVDFYDKLMTYAMDRILDYTAAIDAAGVDLHSVGGNVPGGFLGKATYDTHILPYEKKYIDFVQKNGTPAMYHNCGEIMNLVDSYKGLGVRVVEPFSPPPLGDCADLAAAKRQVDGAYVMLSGIDQVNVLQKGTVDDVKRATEAAMKAGKPGGGFIMQPVDFLEYGTPEKNIEAYVRTAREYGGY